MKLKKYYLFAFLLLAALALSERFGSSMVHNSEPNRPDSKNIKLSVRELLSEYKYSELNTLLDQYQISAEHDISKEQDLMTAYWAFEINDDRLPDLLNSWTNTTPDSYQPYLASAYYYLGKGWDARGDKWSKDTKKEQFDKMDAYFSKAYKNINVVLKKNDQALPAYYVLIGILQSSGDINTMNKVLKFSLSKFPNSYYLRHSYLSAVTPRWGGNYALMQQVINEAKTHIDQNPKLGLLQGDIYDDMGGMKMINKEYDEADKLFTKAISFGDYGTFYCDRGQNSYYRHDYQKALADFNKAIDLYAENSNFYYWRSQAYFMLRNNLLGAQDLLKAALLSPGDKRIVEESKSIAGYLADVARSRLASHDLIGAIVFLDKALELDPDNPDLQSQRNIAINDLQSEINKHPDNPAYYPEMINILIQREDWDSVIAYSNKFLHAAPRNTSSYIWITNAYTKKGNLKKAIQSAKTAADQGNPVGKRLYDKLTKQVN